MRIRRLAARLARSLRRCGGTGRLRPAAFLAMLASAPASAGIEKLESCGVTWPVGAVVLGRGRVNDVTVKGAGVDAASVDSTVPDTPATVVSRNHGPGANIVIRLAPPAYGNRAAGRVFLRYLGGGGDSFDATVAAGPSVASAALMGEIPGAPVIVDARQPAVFILKGTNLDALRPNVELFRRAGLRDASVLLSLPGELRVSFKPDSGANTLDSSLFDVAHAACGQRPPRFSDHFIVIDPVFPQPPSAPMPAPLPSVTPLAVSLFPGSPAPTATPFPIRPVVSPAVQPSFFTPTPSPTPLSSPRR